MTGRGFFSKNDNIGALQKLLPDGKLVGNEWIARNPTRYDQTPGSFKYNVENGLWADFATEDKGKGIQSLANYLKGYENRAAKKAYPDSPQYQRRKPVKTVLSPNKNRSLSPFPGKSVNPGSRSTEAIYEYYDRSNILVGEVICYRYADGSKDFSAKSFQGGSWVYKQMPHPRPIYNLPQVLENAEHLVIICEGEKAAYACGDIFKSSGLKIITTTWAGGCKAWEKSDWSVLAGREVLLWPDADKPGIDAMEALKRHLIALGVKKVKLPELHSSLPEGFDAADIPQDRHAYKVALEILAGKELRIGTCIS